MCVCVCVCVFVWVCGCLKVESGIKTAKKVLKCISFPSTLYIHTVEPLSNQDTNGAEESVIVSEVSSFQRHARVVLGVGKGVLFREVSSVQEIEREVPLYKTSYTSSPP